MSAASAAGPRHPGRASRHVEVVRLEELFNGATLHWGHFDEPLLTLPQGAAVLAFSLLGLLLGFLSLTTIGA